MAYRDIERRPAAGGVYAVSAATPVITVGRTGVAVARVMTTNVDTEGWRTREVSTTPEFRGFDLVRRGYDRHQVDRYLKALSEAGSPPPQPVFEIVRRGYDREQVDARIADLLRGRGAGA
ncbi:hypothetical protein ACIPLC_09150 [Kitasatospora sp. NPDC086801]|uniref:hypothetical protein n=1 Tax=Kitasatospora sp. NPDC086801 TaxID=3364066 RepID=UPI0037FB1302